MTMQILTSFVLIDKNNYSTKEDLFTENPTLANSMNP